MQQPALPVPAPHATPPIAAATPAGTGADAGDRLHEHIVSPAPSTDRLQSIQRLVAEHTGETLPDFASNVLQSIPVQAGGLYPISDIWFIEPALDVPGSLRVHIAQLAQEIAEEAGLAERIEASEDGIGFWCRGERPTPFFARAVFALLVALSAAYRDGELGRVPSSDTPQFADDLAALLQGTHPPRQATAVRLSDAGLVKLFRVIRLARRLLELEALGASSLDGSSDP